MSETRPDASAVYVGDDWLVYADLAFRFERSEFVAPGLLVGRPALPLVSGEGRAVTGPVLLHAGGVWSALSACVGAVLYLDPLTPSGAALQQAARGSIVPLPPAGALATAEGWLGRLAAGAIAAADMRAWVAAASGQALQDTGVTPSLDPRLLPLRAWLHGHGDGRVDVAALAALAGLSADHLRQHFRRQTGMTLSSYQAWLRLFGMASMACREAQGAGADATSMMHAAGFYDASHASRTIRRYFDLRPSEMLAPGCFVDCEARRQGP